MGYLRPTDGRTLSSRADHRRRNPPSQEAGTDIAAEFGTPLRSPADARVYAVAGGTGPATGFYVTLDFDDGRRCRVLHLWDRYVKVGDHIKRGHIFAESGGSGYGSMTAAGGKGTVGQHYHITLWPTHEYSFGTNANTLDFEEFADPVGTPAGGFNASPFIQQEEEMPINIRDTDTKISYTLVPGISLTAHLNAFGARLTTMIQNGGVWPSEKFPDDERARTGEIQLSHQHFVWAIAQYGFLSLAQDERRIPAPGGSVKSDYL